MRVATDVGGTFTDLVFCEVAPGGEGAERVCAVKTHTTPPHFERGVLDALARAGISAEETRFFAHGSTVIINAITERKGAKTALITTQGFRDVLEIGRGNRPDLFNFNFRKPRPFVPRHLRLELNERVDFLGDVHQPVDLDPLPELLNYLRAEQVEAIALCFLHAYVNPENEIATERAIREIWPEVSLLSSHKISREWREFERTSTAVLSAYVHPVARQYIGALQTELNREGMSSGLFLMQSNTGISDVEAVLDNPISMIESGPASGIYAAAWLGEQIGMNNLMVLDIGGTTAKCALIEDGHIAVSTEYHIEKTRTNPGYPVQTPVSEIVEIGNGGGSIAWVDGGLKLHVGPQSAGAMPGPAAYGLGGTDPTTTDANLLLGRIDQRNFVGGEVEPDMTSVRAAFAPLERRLGMDTQSIARGVIRVANANMANALRLVSTNRGHDPRDFCLIAFGGGGAMHAVALAEELNIPRVVVPANSAVFSAVGMLLTDIRKDYLQTNLLELTDRAARTVREVFAELEKMARVEMGRSVGGALEPSLRFTHQLDLRYIGQEHTVKVPIDMKADKVPDVPAIVSAFHAAHEQRYTYRLDAEIQIVNFHLVAISPVEKPQFAVKPVSGLALEDTVLHERMVDFDTHGEHQARVYDGLRMEAGMELSGPAVIQEPSMTLVIPPGHQASVDQFGNYHVLLHHGNAT